MGSTNILVATTTTTIRHDGRRIVLRGGVTLVHADDPIVKGHEDLFRPLQVEYLGSPVEQATAAPGEKRSVQVGAGESKTRAKPRRKPADS